MNILKRVRACNILALSVLINSSRAVFGQNQSPSQQLPDTETARDLFSQILGFLYTIAHWLGQGIVNIVQGIIPSLQIPASVVDPIGVLAVVTVIMLIAEVSRKLIWLIIGLGWALIVIRLLIAGFQGGA